MKEMSKFDWVAFVLLLIGGLNWGLVGLFRLDLVILIFGGIPVLARIIYILVGLSALWVFFKALKACKEPSSDMSNMKTAKAKPAKSSKKSSKGKKRK